MKSLFYLIYLHQQASLCSCLKDHRVKFYYKSLMQKSLSLKIIIMFILCLKRMEQKQISTEHINFNFVLENFIEEGKYRLDLLVIRKNLAVHWQFNYETSPVNEKLCRTDYNK